MEATLRPWQGTLLGVLCYIGVAISVLLGLAFIFGLSFLSGIFSGAAGGAVQGAINSGQLDSAAAVSVGAVSGGIQGLFAGLGMIAGFFFLIVGLIDFFIGRAVMNGKKWSLIVIIIFSALGLLGSLSGPAYVSLVSSGAMIALSATVLKHPFYNHSANPVTVV